MSKKEWMHKPKIEWRKGGEGGLGTTRAVINQRLMDFSKIGGREGEGGWGGGGATRAAKLSSLDPKNLPYF